MEHNDDILIDRFLRGELTENEKKKFQARLEEEGFSRRVKVMEDVHAGVRESVLEEKRDILEGLEAEVVSKDRKSQSRSDSIEGKGKSNERVKTRRLWWLAAAAAVVIGAIIFWPEEKVELSPEYVILLEDEFETLIKHETLRSSHFEDPYTAEQREAYNRFMAKDFKRAIPLLEMLWVDNKDSLAKEYLGYSLIFTGKISEGEEILNK